MLVQGLPLGGYEQRFDRQGSPLPASANQREVQWHVADAAVVGAIAGAGSNLTGARDGALSRP